MNFDPNVCTQVLTQCGYTPVCPSQHCQDFQETPLYHSDCAGEAMYHPVQSMGCYNQAKGVWQFDIPQNIGKLCMSLMQQDPNWELLNCYCCCSCFARATPITVPTGAVAIGDLVEGDEILAGSVNGGGVTWSPQRLGFSQGSTGGYEPAMVYLHYGDEDRALIASVDQPLMLADGKLTTAGVLVPGQSLVDQDGNAVPLKTVSLGAYTGGVHHIATQTRWHGSVDGHLMLAGGVVAGDFTLQLHFRQVDGALKVDEHDALPAVGTPEYVAQHGLAHVGERLVFAASPDAAGPPEGPQFSSYAVTPVALPHGAASFLTDKQAADLVASGKQRPISDRSGSENAQQGIALVSGFYRDFVFHLDWSRNEPNVWAFEQYGQKVVLVAGGLARMTGLLYEGITMAIAHGVARFIGGAPHTVAGLSCTGQADLYAFGVISQKIWFGNPWLKETMAGYQQLQELFGLVTSPNAGGNPLDVCDDPGIECRLNTMMTALAGGALPECAGGPKPPPLTLESATGTPTEATLVFSTGLTAETAEKTANYTLTPAATITAATLDPKEDFTVHLAADLAAGSYEISCTALASEYGATLTPDPSVAKFDV
jgi:hypothetical protein